MSDPKIKKIELVGTRPRNRKVKVTLSNKTKITIVACQESWEQFGGTRDELWLTVPIAEKYNAWLHGADLVS